MLVPSFHIEQRQHGRRYVLLCSGELDTNATPKLEETIKSLCTAGALEVELDLREVEFVDSAGVAAIVSAMHACREHKAQFFVVPSRDPRPRRAFEILHLDAVVPWRET
jgi:anti-sigma B factor antagonist